MIKIFKYETEKEAEEIKSKMSGYTLIEIANITEGNFLAFADNSKEIPTEPVNTIALESIQDNQLTIMSAIADLYTSIQGGT